MARKIEHLAGQPQQVLVHRVLGVQPGAEQGVRGPPSRSAAAAWATRSRRGLGNAQHLAHVANRGARPVADEVGHHGGVAAAVLEVDVLDHLFAPLVLDVEVDVGRLGPLTGEEPLEEQSQLAPDRPR